VALTEFELPCELVSCTETALTGEVLLENVKGMVREKLLPYGAEVGSAYQVVKTGDSETVA
jgi:hypothetical protein